MKASPRHGISSPHYIFPLTELSPHWIIISLIAHPPLISHFFSPRKSLVHHQRFFPLTSFSLPSLMISPHPSFSPLITFLSLLHPPPYSLPSPVIFPSSRVSPHLPLSPLNTHGLPSSSNKLPSPYHKFSPHSIYFPLMTHFSPHLTVQFPLTQMHRPLTTPSHFPLTTCVTFPSPLTPSPLMLVTSLFSPHSSSLHISVTLISLLFLLSPFCLSLLFTSFPLTSHIPL